MFRYGVPRAATVIATEPGELWVLEKVAFKKVLFRSARQRQQVMNVLRHVPIFDGLLISQMQQLVDASQEQSFGKDEKIIENIEKFI